MKRDFSFNYNFNLCAHLTFWLKFLIFSISIFSIPFNCFTDIEAGTDKETKTEATRETKVESKTEIKTDNKKGKLTPDGRTIIDKAQNIPFIDAVNVMGAGNLIINQTDKQGLELIGEDKVLPLVQLSVKDSALFIELKESEVKEGTKMTYQLNIKNLQSITTSGASSVNFIKTLTTSSLVVAIKGSGDSILKLDVEKLNISIHGGTKVMAFGKAAAQSLEIKGAGTFDGTQLSGKTMKVNINGAGAAFTHVSDILDIDISGVGDVKYCENPEIIKKINGTGNIKALPEKECILN